MRQRVSIGRAKDKKVLRETGEKYRSLFEGSRDAILITSRKGKIIGVNNSALELFGYTREEMLKLNAQELWSDSSERRKFQKEVERTGYLKDYELKYRKKDGAVMYCLNTASLREDKSGDILGYQGIIRDITEQKKTGQALRESEEKYRNLFEQSRDAIVFTTRDGAFVDVNQSASELFGYAKEDLLKLNIKELYVNPLDRVNFLREIEEKGDVRDYEVRHRRKDGAVIYCLNTASLRKDKDGNILGYQGIIRDITEQKKAEQALRESEEKYRNLFEQSRDAIYISTREGRFVDINQSMLELFSFNKEEMLNMAARELYSNPLDRDRFQEQIERDGFVRDYATKFLRRDGTHMDCLLTATLRKDDNGKVLGYQGIIRDVTEQKQAQEKLISYQNQLRELASELSLIEQRERRQMATYLHDNVGQALALLKIKLGSLKEFVNSPESYSIFSEIIILIEKTIQETRSLTFELSPPILYELGFEAAVEWLVEQIQEHHGILCSFENDLQPKPLDENVRGALFQGVRELLLNVVKHGAASKSKVSIRRDGDNINVKVEDDGIGFETSKIDSQKGFGLFNIRERLSHFGGHLKIESGPRDGTRITIVMPMKHNE
jgi:PAS domain S-box-containing protein